MTRVAPCAGFGSAVSTTSVPYVAKGQPSAVEQSGTAPLPGSAQQVLSPISSAAVLGGESTTWQDSVGYPQMLPAVVQPQSVLGGTIQPLGVPAGIDSSGAHLGSSRCGLLCSCSALQQTCRTHDCNCEWNHPQEQNVEGLLYFCKHRMDFFERDMCSNYGSLNVPGRTAFHLVYGLFIIVPFVLGVSLVH